MRIHGRRRLRMSSTAHADGRAAHPHTNAAVRRCTVRRRVFHFGFAVPVSSGCCLQQYGGTGGAGEARSVRTERERQLRLCSHEYANTRGPAAAVQCRHV